MIEVKASTKRGQRLIKMGSHYEGSFLSQIYNTWSQEKQNAYDWCYEQYLKCEEHTAFSICSHNTFGFTCSWLYTQEGEDIMRIETKDNTYIVYLER